MLDAAPGPESDVLPYSEWLDSQDES
jgi:hypothetical protein